MSFSLSAAAICFIACHGGPADHFATFAEDLAKKGYDVQIYATGPALKKFEDRHIKAVTSFSLENVSQEEVALQLAKKCSRAAVIITDVGHAFDATLQKALASESPNSLRLAYYDNPEAWVPGGYSSTAATVMLAAQKVLFANANLAKTPVYEAPSQEICLEFQKRVGLGYYPIEQAEKIAERRLSEQSKIRAQFFSKYGLNDERQKLLVYAGGNNDDYFSKALPAFLQYLHEASLEKKDLSHLVILLQQHPGAKEKNIDGKLVQQWIEQHNEKAGSPRFYLSDLTSEDAQVAADGMLYYQTSMGPQFVLAGIPTIQVGHDTYEDILVKNKLCLTATNREELVKAFSHLQENGAVKPDCEAIKKGLGISADWASNLENALTDFVPRL